MTGLDGGKHTLTPNDLVVADGKGVVALAGIVGGADSAVQPATQKVLLEVASFDAGTVRKRHDVFRSIRNHPNDLPEVG